METTPIPDEQASEHLRRLLRDDEDLLWSSKPPKAAWYVGRTVGVPVALGVVALLLGAPVGGVVYMSQGGLGLGFGTLAGYGLAALAVVTLLSGAVAHLSYRHAELALTDDRIVHLHGVVGRDTRSIDLDDIQDVAVNVAPGDVPWGTGTLHVKVARGGTSGLTIATVAHPYDVVERIEEARAAAS